jgi:hypothetical protein
MAKNGGDNNRKVKISEDAKEFAKLTLKKFKKESDGYYDSKKELKQSYQLYLIDLLPKTIEFVVKFGYIKDDTVQETKEAIYAKLVDEDFVKVLKKEIKNGNKIENIKLLPIIIKDILLQAEKSNAELLANDPNAKIYDMSDLVELTQLILKKRLKKMAKAGIDENIAFDTLSIIPTDIALKSSQNYRIHMFYECLYEHSKSKVIPFNDIMKVIVDEEYYPMFIAFALLERKEKFGKLTDNQKTFYLAVSSWCFDTMEKLNKDVIRAIITSFIRGRQRDESKNNDSNRRYALGSLSETDYPRIAKTIKAMIAENDSIKKYF